MNLNISRFARIFVVLFLVSCGAEQTPSNDSSNKDMEEIPAVDSKDKKGELAPEKINQMRDSVEQVKTAISPFLNEGCCGEDGRKAETCCCQAVYEKYKSMLDNENPDAVEIGMTDPILANCRKLMPKAFDQLENPPSEEPDELDDLFN